MKFNVTFSRPTYESVVVQVEADDEEAAQDAAENISDKTLDALEWEHIWWSSEDSIDIDDIEEVEEEPEPAEPAKFNHAYSFGFEVMSNHPEAEDVTAQMLVSGLRHRIDRIEREDVSEMLNACDWFDVMEEPEG